MNADTIEFEKFGILKDFDDGHIPEGVESPTKLYQSKHNHDETERTAAQHASTPSVQVCKEALPPSLSRQIYHHTVEREIPWGTYVTKEEAMAVHVQCPPLEHHVVHVDETSPSKFPEGKRESTNDNDMIQKLATCAVRHFIFKHHDEDKSSQNIQQIAGHRLSPNLDSKVHGVQIWALPAKTGSSVPYHIDYAEYIRYTHNVIVTPLYAGTVQCTPHSVKGGTFAVNLGGLQHYQNFGYKCALKKKNNQDKMAEWSDNDVKQVQVKDDGWVSIPYRFNQGIMHTGSLPHLSGTVMDVERGKRVIVGFNVFDHDIGPIVSKCPEHSDQFRKMVKWHRSIRNATGTARSGGIKLERIRENKALTKLLILAKRQKVKEQWEEIRKMMTMWLIEQLDDNDSEGRCRSQHNMKISELLKRWRKDDGRIVLDTIQPSADDLHVHIHQLLKKGDVESNRNRVHFYAFDELGCSINKFVGGRLVSIDFSIGAKLKQATDYH